MKILNAVIEIPKDSPIKYEYHRFEKKIIVDRILRDEYVYPCNYGYIPQTLDWDGDELDVLLYSEFTFAPGSQLRIKIIGALQMIDEGEKDTKLIAIHADDYRSESIKNLDDLPKSFLEKIEWFFNNYKRHKGPVIELNGFRDAEWANHEYKICIELMEKYGKLPKDTFIKTMMEKFPENYS